ncbi:MAG: PAS domain-containing protein, partial [Oleiharenicola lentus]
MTAPHRSTPTQSWLNPQTIVCALALVALAGGVAWAQARVGGDALPYVLASAAIAAIALIHAGWLAWQVRAKTVSEQKLQTTVAQLKASWDDAPLSVILFDPHATDVPIKIVDCNRRALEMHGYTREELIGQSIDFIEANKWAHKTPNWIEPFRHGKTFEGESEHVRKDGSRFWIEYSTSLVVIDGREFVLGMDRDATARKLAEKALGESQERWSLAVAGSNEGVWDWNIEHEAMWLSPRWKSMLGFFDDELPSRREVWMDRIHPDDRLHVETAFANHLMQNSQILHCEYRIVHKDGSWLWALVRGKALFGDDG